VSNRRVVRRRSVVAHRKAGGAAEQDVNGRTVTYVHRVADILGLLSYRYPLVLMPSTAAAGEPTSSSVGDHVLTGKPHDRCRSPLTNHSLAISKEHDVSFGDFLWSLLIIYFIFFYFMILFRIIGDLFSDHEMSGLGKTGWIIFLVVFPFLAMFIYLITHGKDMTERAMAHEQAAAADQQDYIRQVAGSGNNDPAAQIAKGHELLSSGAITQQEFDSLKAKALA
jgi:hypothetical protein